MLQDWVKLYCSLEHINKIQKLGILPQEQFHSLAAVISSTTLEGKITKIPAFLVLITISAETG